MLSFNEYTNEKNDLQEAPVKPKEKEKEKEKIKTPNKNPSINPWKREPDVKPGEEPAPKALLESKINSKEGMAFVSWKNVHHGFDIEFTIQGGVKDGDRPKDWEKQLENALNEAETMIMKKLPWLQ